MKSLIVHKDGRLKTGRLTGLVFLALLGTTALSFEVSEPLQEQVVMVKHRFTPEEPAENPLTPESVEKTEKNETPEKQEEQPQAKAPQPPAQQEVKLPPAPEKMEVVEAEVVDTTGVMQEFIQLADKPVSPEVKPMQLADTSRLQNILGKSLKPEAAKKPAEKGQDASEATVEHLSPAEFLSLMQSWRNAGNGTDGVKQMSLEIKGLKEMYPALQMKPVAVHGTRYFDLTSGEQIAEASLANYSSTVFEVTNGNHKFSEPLQRLGLLEQPGVEVRYYMYEFIRNSIYARAHAAFAWCLDGGLIAADTPLAEVEITGSAFQIKQQGGGKFAVFIPQQLATAKGERVTIDPDCFAGQADVHYLRKTGVL